MIGKMRGAWNGSTRPITATLSLALLAGTAAAQTTLPPVVVTTPSPIVRPTPAQVAPPAPAAKSAPAQKRPAQKAAAAQPSQAPPPADAAPPPSVAAAPAAEPPPGVLIVDERSFVSVTVVPDREIIAQQGANVADSIQYRPGITASTFAPGASRPVIRGFDNNRVRVQENGIGSHDVSALSEDHAVPIDPNAASRIEVVRGPATLRYGSQAIGGVVNATNGRIPEMIPRHGVAAEMFGGISSVDNGRDSGFRATGGAGNFAVYADGFERHADDYRTPHGRQLNSFVDATGHAVGGSFIGRDGYIGVAYSRYSSLYGIPGGESAERRTRIDLEQEKIQTRGEWRPGAFGVEAVRFWYGGSRYGHNEISFNADEGIDETGSRFTNREREARVEVQHLPVGTVLGELRGAVGVQLGRRAMEGKSFEGDSILDLARTRTAAAFWFEELQVTSRLRLQAALRYENNNVDGVGLDLSDPLAPVAVAGERTFKPVSGSGGLLYDLPRGVVFRATAQYTERAPDAAELFSKGLHEATGTFEIGNPFLRIEKARTFEIGLRRARGAFRFDASVYHTTFDGFIFKRLTGGRCDDTIDTCESFGGAGEELKELRFDQRDATFYGTELIGQLDVAPLWTGVWGIEGQYDFVHAEFANGENVPRIPPHRLGGGLYWRNANWLAKVSVLHAFRQDKIGEGETPTSGYTLLNAELGYTRRIDLRDQLSPEFTVGIKGDNLLNEDVRNHVSFKKDEVLLPGASVRLFGRIKLQ